MSTAVLLLFFYGTGRPLVGFSTVLVSIATHPLVSSLLAGRDLLSPRVLLPLTYLGYALGPLFGSMVDIRPSFPEPVYGTYALVQLIGLISMRLGLWNAEWGYRGDLRDGFPSRPKPITHWPLTSSLLTTGILGGMAAVSLISYLQAFGGLEGLVRVGYGADYYQTLAANFVVGLGPIWFPLAVVLLFATGLRHKRRSYLLMAGAAGAIVYYGLLLLGARGTIVYTLLFGIALFNYGVRPLRSGTVLLGLVLGVLLSVAYSFMRYALPDLRAAVAGALEALVRNPSLLNPLRAGEFVMPGSSLLEVIGYDHVPLLLGRSYIGALGQPFPLIARLFEQVGFDVNHWRLEAFYPQSLAIRGGLGFSPVTEAYMNFRLPGVALHMILYGWIAGWAYNHLRKRRSFGALLLWAGTLPILALDGMRIHTASWVYKWFRGYLMPWIVYSLITATAHGLTRLQRRHITGSGVWWQV